MTQWHKLMRELEKNEIKACCLIYEIVKNLLFREHYIGLLQLLPQFTFWFLGLGPLSILTITYSYMKKVRKIKETSEGILANAIRYDHCTHRTQSNNVCLTLQTLDRLPNKATVVWEFSISLTKHTCVYTHAT